MALVHSRIGRVFYGMEMADGAFRTNFQIHSKQSLNHHFPVYSNVLGDECRALPRGPNVDK
jgi:tRNA-specific adenosine deaminase 3